MNTTTTTIVPARAFRHRAGDSRRANQIGRDRDGHRRQTFAQACYEAGGGIVCMCGSIEKPIIERPGCWPQCPTCGCV